MWLAILLLLLLIGLSVGTYLWLRHKVLHHVPENYPAPSRVVPGKAVVVCAGDSITHGNTGANFVAMLAQQRPDLQFFNAGRNADLTYTLLNRLDDVIGMRPDVVTVLIGTNDVQATMGQDKLEVYRQIGRIAPDVVPTFESFQANYQTIIRRLRSETHARIAVASLPIIGEDLAHEANRRADRYSLFIRELAEAEQLTYLPVREAMTAYLRAHKPTCPPKYDYDQARLLLTYSVARHYLLGQSWDKICHSHGNQLTQDMLHFNSVGAGLIAGEVAKSL
jgi:lysophospholipase L1-like esterase